MKRGRPAGMHRSEVVCGGCGREIEGCTGLHGEWMHTASRREACPAGGWATPETEAQWVARQSKTMVEWRRRKRERVAA